MSCECEDPRCPSCRGECVNPPVMVVYHPDLPRCHGKAVCEACAAWLTTGEDPYLSRTDYEEQVRAGKIDPR